MHLCPPQNTADFLQGNVLQNVPTEHSLHWVAVSQGDHEQVDSIVIPAPGSAWDGEWRTCGRPEGSTGFLAAALRTGLGMKSRRKTWSYWEEPRGLLLRGNNPFFNKICGGNIVNYNLKLQQVIIAQSPVPWGQLRPPSSRTVMWSKASLFL